MSRATLSEEDRALLTQLQLGASSAVIGKVGVQVGGADVSAANRVPIASKTRSVSLTPTVTASAYTTGNVVGGKLTFANLFGPSGSGVVHRACLRWKSAQTALFNLYLFTSNPSASTLTDQAAPSLNAADALKPCGPIQFTSPLSDLGAHTSYDVPGLNFAAAPGTTDVYGVLIFKSGSLTPGSTADLQVELVALGDD